MNEDAKNLMGKDFSLGSPVKLYRTHKPKNAVDFMQAMYHGHLALNYNANKISTFRLTAHMTNQEFIEAFWYTGKRYKRTCAECKKRNKLTKFPTCRQCKKDKITLTFKKLRLTLDQIRKNHG